MKTSKILAKISNGEDSYTQFKEKIISAKDLAKEFVAFSNSEGGIIIFGVSDDGKIKGLEQGLIESIGQLIGNVANENVKPPIHPITQNISIEDKKLIVVIIEQGVNKPYATSSGDYYIKSSSDKKKISQEQLRRLFAESRNLYANEQILSRTDITDINMELFYQFVAREDANIYEDLKNGDLNLETILDNYGVMDKKHLTLSGNLIFAKLPQKFSPSFYIDCVYFIGNDVSSNQYLSERRIKGTLKTLYTEALAFIKSHLKRKQVEQEFNSPGVLEIDEIVLSELIINALIHRDYYINAPVKIFLFDNRLEIISPGRLTNSLTVEKIKKGLSIHRNPILNSLAKYVLHYSGRGSGIKRVFSINPEIKLINDIEKEEFRCIIPREEKINPNNL
jgi:ATP-dependent DNA helicase RecG